MPSIKFNSNYIKYIGSRLLMFIHRYLGFDNFTIINLANCVLHNHSSSKSLYIAKLKCSDIYIYNNINYNYNDKNNIYIYIC